MLKNSFNDVGIRPDSLFGIFRGVVEDRNDPMKLGRCRIRVYGIHSANKSQTDIDGIPTAHLPWAEPALSLVEGSVSGFGLWSVPLQGSHVFVFFENGNVMQPRFFASAPGKPIANPDIKMGFNDPNGEYPNKTRVNESDYHRLARGEKTDSTYVKYRTDNLKKDTKTADTNTWQEPNPAYAAKYPDNIVLATHTGISIEIDTTPGQQRVTLFHPSNTYFEITKDGNLIIRNEKDSFEIVKENKKSVISKNLDATVEQNRTHYTQGNDTEKVGDFQKITIGAEQTVDIGDFQKITIGADQTITVGGNCTINVSGTCKINASNILLNS